MVTADQQWDDNCMKGIQGINSDVDSKGDCHKTRCDGRYQQWSAMRSVSCKISRGGWGVILVSIWLGATHLVGMRTILQDNLFSADGMWSSSAVYTSRVTTVDSLNLILLECNNKSRDAPTFLAGSAHNSTTHRCGLWFPQRATLMKI